MFFVFSFVEALNGFEIGSSMAAISLSTLTPFVLWNKHRARQLFTKGKTPQASLRIRRV
jgi:hypothetical protein